MNPVNLIAGVNRVILNTVAPVAPTDGVADDANIAGMFIYSRVPIRIWQMSNANTWTELDLLTGAAGSRIATVYFDATDVTRIFLQSTGDDNVTVRVVRREQEGSNVQQEGANQRVHVAATFRSLSDTPNAYAGQAGKYPRVNDGETAIEFVESSGEGAQGPQGPQGPAGADGAAGTLSAQHVHEGSLTIDSPGSTSSWSVKPTNYWGRDQDPDDSEVEYTNPLGAGLTPDITNNLPSETVISNFHVGGTHIFGSANFHSTYTTPYAGWAPIHGKYDPRYRGRNNAYTSNYGSWVNWTASGDSENGADFYSNPRFYTYGPVGGGPSGAKLNVTGTISMTPESNIFFGDPNGTNMDQYPETWGAGDADALFISRNNYVNNSNDTYYQFGDKRSLVNFASSSHINFKNATMKIAAHATWHTPDFNKPVLQIDKYKQDDYGHWFYNESGFMVKETFNLIDPWGRINLPIGTKIYNQKVANGRETTFNRVGIETDEYGYFHCNPKADFYGSTKFWAGNGATNTAEFNADVEFKGDVDFTEADSVTGLPVPSSFPNHVHFASKIDVEALHLNKGNNSVQPVGTNSPLMIRQPGQNFGHSVMLECPYVGQNTQGWGIRVDSTKELVFQAFQLDVNGNLVDGTWNNASFGRGYLSDATDVGQITFTGQHRSLPAEGTVADFQNKVGLIVVSTGKYASMTEEDITINDAMPKVEISSKANDKRAFGVVSNVEDVDSDERRFQLGLWGSSMDKPEGDDRVIINSVGEGAMWVTDINGNLENGDYITTSDLEGYGMKQDDDLLHNYTVAKITMDCDFDLNSTEYRCEQIGPYKRAFVGVTYHCG